jgi:hypothetical protein
MSETSASTIGTEARLAGMSRRVSSWEISMAEARLASEQPFTISESMWKFRFQMSLPVTVAAVGRSWEVWRPRVVERMAVSSLSEEYFDPGDSESARSLITSSIMAAPSTRPAFPPIFRNRPLQFGRNASLMFCMSFANQNFLSAGCLPQ